MSDSDKLMIELVKGHTESATATKILLENIGDVLSTMCERLTEIENFIKDIQISRKSFYKYTVRTFLVIFAAQTIIIGLLLKRLNVEGADVIKAVGSTTMSVPLR